MTGAPLVPHSHAAHYRNQAETFRQMAAVEPNEVIQGLLLKVADAYQKLGDHLAALN